MTRAQTVLSIEGLNVAYGSVQAIEMSRSSSTGGGRGADQR